MNKFNTFLQPARSENDERKKTQVFSDKAPDNARPFACYMDICNY